MTRLYCGELADAFGEPYAKGYLPSACCDSCHDDFDGGYTDLLNVEYGGGKFEVCCRMAEKLSERPEAPVIEG
jgi:hypothetical protein